MKNAIKVSALGILLFVVCIALTSWKKEDNSKPTNSKSKNKAVKYGTLHYTITDYSGSQTVDEELGDDSYCDIGKQSNISIADKNGRFFIGIIKAGGFEENEQHMIWKDMGANRNNYSIATYLINNPDHTVKPVSFERGMANIVTFDVRHRNIKVYFNFAMLDAAHKNALTELKGYAILNHII